MNKSRLLVPHSIARGSVLLAALLVLLTATALLSVFSNAVSSQVEHSVDHRLTDGSAVFRQNLDAERRAMLTSGDLLASDTAFAASLATGDVPAATNLMKLVIQAPVDALALVDLDGRVLSALSSRQHATSVADIAAKPAFQQALLGRPADEISFNPEDELEQAVYVPVMNAAQEPVAVLRLAALENGLKLDTFRATTGLHVSLFHKGARVATTLRDRAGEPVRVADQALLDDVASTGRSRSLGHTLPSGRIRSFYQPLLGADGSIIGVWSVGLPYDAILGEFGAALMPGVPLTVAIVLLAALLALLLGRVFTRPVFTLRDAARRMQEGDLSTPVPHIRATEFLALRDELEHARWNMQSRMADLVQREAQQRELFSAIREPIIITHPNGRIDSYNLAAASMFGEWRLKDRSVRRLLPFLPADALSGETSTWQGGVKNLDDGELDVEVNQAAVIDTPHGPRYVFVIHDVSPYTALSRQREDLLHSVAHELTNPLTILQSSLELLADSDLDDSSEAQTIVASARRTVGRLHWLTRNLLNAGSIQSGRFQITRLEQDLADILREAVSSSSEMVKQRSQHIETDIPLAGAHVLVDPAFIHQATYNLLTNASKYSPEGEVIKLKLELDGGVARVSVTDRGAGIPVEKQAELFQRFYRANGKGTGVGLGLAIMKGIVEAHGGQVGLHSLPGLGSTFWFTLPMTAPLQSAVRAEPAAC